jgi:hypothetical protein
LQAENFTVQAISSIIEPDLSKEIHKMTASDKLMVDTMSQIANGRRKNKNVKWSYVKSRKDYCSMTTGCGSKMSLNERCGSGDNIMTA